MDLKLHLQGKERKRRRSPQAGWSGADLLVSWFETSLLTRPVPHRIEIEPTRTIGRALFLPIVSRANGGAAFWFGIRDNKRRALYPRKNVWAIWKINAWQIISVTYLYMARFWWEPRSTKVLMGRGEQVSLSIFGSYVIFLTFGRLLLLFFFLQTTGSLGDKKPDRFESIGWFLDG